MFLAFFGICHQVSRKSDFLQKIIGFQNLVFLTFLFGKENQHDATDHL